MSPQHAVLITRGEARASSEAETNAAVRRLLPRLYPTVEENPEHAPCKGRYDLWSVLPFECHPKVPWERLYDGAVARVAIDCTDAHPAADVVLLTIKTARSNPSVDRLLQLWGVEWRGQRVNPRWHWGWTKPHLPYVHACADGLAIPEDAPYAHAVWNVEHWCDNPDQHAYAVAAIPALAEMGVKIIYLTRCERGGVPPLDDIEDLGISVGVLSAPEQPKHVSDGHYAALFDAAAAYLVSVPSIGMISIEKALARGIPVVGAPTNRWSEWFTAPDALRAFAQERDLYAKARERHYHLFSDDAAVGQFELARELARIVRE